MSTQIPTRFPPCAVNLLARQEWFNDPGVVSRARLGLARGIPRLLSSHLFARQEIAAITLGRTINFRRLDYYDPHTPAGLALLAHELKHVEQYERAGRFKFYAKYAGAYLSKGYGKSVPFEAEAYEFQGQVMAHLVAEFANNVNCSLCQEMADPHNPNGAYVKTSPQQFRYPR